MAPTICTEKVCRVRNKVRETRKNIQNSSSSSSVISYVGKITHRRSVTVRSATSKLSTQRLSRPDNGESSTEDESDSRTDDEHDMIIDSNTLNCNNNTERDYNITSPSSSSSSSSLQSVSSPLNTSTYDISSITDSNSPLSVESNCSSAVIGSDASTNISCDRTNDSAYESICKCKSCYIDDDIDNNSTTSTVIIRFKHSNIIVDDDYTQSTTFSSALDDDQLSLDTQITDDYQDVNQQNDEQLYNSNGLLDIAMKTIKLIKRNQVLQKKLSQLQYETRAFIESVLANPENHALRDKIQKQKKIKA